MPGPLQGVKVIDLSAVVSGPMATGILADQGAEVIKIEARQGDLTRVIGPAVGDRSSMYIAINRGKRAMVLDLKHPDGAQVLRELLAGADVLVENFRPGALARLGFSYESVSALNPRLVYLSISGFGQSGPFAGYRVYDPVIQAVSGFADSHPDPVSNDPRLLKTLMCDKITALTAAQALCAALVARQQTGRGQRIELSMLDAAIAFGWPEAFYNHALLDASTDPVPEYGATQTLWPCQDGWVAIVTPQNDEFAGLCRTLGVPELTQDPRFASVVLRRRYPFEIRALLEPLVAQWTVDDLVAQLGAAGVPVGRANRKHELPDDPQVRHNAVLTETAYEGIGRVRAPRAAAVFSDGALQPSPVAARLGEHTRDVLRELGRSDAQIDALFASGAAG